MILVCYLELMICFLFNKYVWRIKLLMVWKSKVRCLKVVKFWKINQMVLDKIYYLKRVVLILGYLDYF